VVLLKIHFFLGNSAIFLKKTTFLSIFLKKMLFLTLMSPTNIKYSASVKRLEEILESIDRSNVGIDELADLVKEAAELIKNCRALIASSEQSVQESLKTLEEA